MLNPAFALGVPLLKFVRGLVMRHAFEAAAAVAFWFFLSVVPLLVLLGSVVGHVARTRGVEAIAAPLLDVIPAMAEGIVRQELDRLAHGSATSVAPAGLLGYTWTASSGLHNLMRAFESSVLVRRRPWWKARAIAVGWVFAGLAMAAVLAFALVRMNVALHPGEAAARAAAHAHGTFRRGMRKPFQSPAEQALAAGLLLAGGMVLLAGFYRFAVEHPRRVRRRVWPGTVAAVLGWLVVSWAFGAYAVSIADYTLYYGGLAAVTVLLLWLYLTSLALIVGAEVNALAEGLRRERSSLRPLSRSL